MKTSAGRWAALLLILTVAAAGCSHFRGWMSKPRPPYKKLTPEIAYEMIRDSPGMLVLDLRTPQQFNGTSSGRRTSRWRVSPTGCSRSARFARRPS